MYKEIVFNESQEGFGLAVTNTYTRVRMLFGIYTTWSEARYIGEKMKRDGTVNRPVVVEWNKRNYTKYTNVYEKL